MYTGKPSENDMVSDHEYKVFPDAIEQEILSRLAGLGMTVKYHKQRIELKECITVIYMKILNPETGLSVSLIPWFLVVGRPYPVFIYAYGIGHYQKSDKKSLDDSATVVRKVFGVSKFHKSTLSRSITAMDELVDISLFDEAIHADVLERPIAPSVTHPNNIQNYETVMNLVCGMLVIYSSFEELKMELGDKIKRLPKPINRAGRILHALSNVPESHFKIIMPGGSENVRRRDIRKRPPRMRRKKKGHVQRNIRFVDFAQREKIRKEFIEICCHIVVGTAIQYHRFLI